SVFISVLPKSIFSKRWLNIRKNADTIHVLAASLQMTPMVKLATEKKIMDNVPDKKANNNL
ncbi:hypothetical protein, partial [Pseudoalteromonas sp. S410]|uniref:hypothetical protein n=1 Tax=Pseudoalteromonas sp. S410 TaxID=2066517 RepID=UPI001BB17129